jgi:UDP-N-acetylglucosamine acyltransferase
VSSSTITPTTISQNNYSFEENFFSSPDTYIHPSAIVGPHVVLGSNVKIGPGCVVVGNVTIGDNTRIYAHSIIGYPAQDLSVKEPQGSIIIGANCQIREYVSIHAPKIKDAATSIGNNCYLMNHCHVGHDVVLEDNVTLINGVNLGGHVHIEKGAMLMAGAAVHQFCRIGTFACLTPFSGTRQDLPPYSMFSGQPAGFAALNRIALKRAGVPQSSIENLRIVTRIFYQEKKLLNVLEEQARDSEWGNDPYVCSFIEFIRKSARGVSKRTLSYGSQNLE